MLGARWDAVAKKWFVSKDVQLELFTAWLPQESFGHDERLTTLSHPLLSEDDVGIPLSHYLLQVADAVMRSVPRSQWVRAEISQVRAINGGHLSLELVEHDASGRLTARVAAFLWSARAGTLKQKFELATGAHLAAGLKIMVQVSAEFSATYGLRTVIEDIDPSYTLGDIEAKLKAIREELKQKGLINRNKSLLTPVEFTRVAVISPTEAAGLGDFRQDADHLDTSGICQFTYYTATFQGPDAQKSLIKAISALEDDSDRGIQFDAVCIIRGGGSVTDLYWLNELSLAEAICRLPIPVFTGIGHERDNTILDEVAHQRFDTPSKVIGWISGTILQNATQAIEHLLSILKRSQEIIALNESLLESSYTEITHRSRQAIMTSEHDIEQHLATIRQVTLERISESEALLERQHATLHQSAQLQLLEAERDIENSLQLIRVYGQKSVQESEQTIEALAREILGAGPDATLKRGFTLTRTRSGQPITSAKTAQSEGTLDLEFHDGHLNVKVTQSHGDKSA